MNKKLEQKFHNEAIRECRKDAEINDKLPKSHPPVICQRDKHRTLYVGKGWKSWFVCPLCNRGCYQHLNFLGHRNVICNGLKFSKEAKPKNYIQGVEQLRKDRAEAEAQRIPETIRLNNASGLTVRVTIEDERFTRVVTVSGCVVEHDAIEAVSPYLNSNFLQRVETEVL